jgi:Mg-chelatase subunit ChlD
VQWLRSSYVSTGLTQYPIGRYLSKVQEALGGIVILCLDVSGSMSISDRLPQAVEGCELFCAKALSLGYSIGMVLWHHGIAGSTHGFAREDSDAKRLLRSAIAEGGTNILPTLRYCEDLLDGHTGDRVIAIFGDGDLVDAQAAISEANRLIEKDIRVVTCGLGYESGQQLGVIDSASSETPRVADPADIAGAIAGMASSLKRRV